MREGTKPLAIQVRLNKNVKTVWKDVDLRSMNVYNQNHPHTNHVE